MTGELQLLDALLSGKAPRNARLAAAKALIPLPLPEQLLVLIRLTADPDKIVNSEANATLEAIPEERILPVLQSEETNPEILDYFAFDPTRSSQVPQAVAMNNTAQDNTIAELAQVADGSLLEIILLNQTRLIRHPAIMDAFLANAAATTEITRRISELQTEFFVKTGRTPSVAVPIPPSMEASESDAPDASPPLPAD
jgi:HEAT repeat protein